MPQTKAQVLSLGQPLIRACARTRPSHALVTTMALGYFPGSEGKGTMWSAQSGLKDAN